MAEYMGRVDSRRALIELDHYQHLLCPGRGHIAFENIKSLHQMLELFIRFSGLSMQVDDYLRRIRLTTFNWHFDTLPTSFNDYRILHLSDLHIDALDGLSAEIHRAIENTHPNLIVLTGDYRFRTGGNNHLVFEYMKQLVADLPCCDGVFGILGNHDSEEFIEPFEAMGIKMLINESVILERGADRIALLGVDDCHYYGTDDLSKALKDVDAGLFKILLVHSPELIKEAAAAEIDFYLCGHTHGGQIRVPFFGAPIVNAACSRRFADRRWRHGHTQGYTHRGTGSSCIPVRFYCPPEVTLHVLNPRATL